MLHRLHAHRFDWIYGLIFLYIHVYSSCRSLKDAGLSALLHAGSCGLRRWMSSQASSTKHVQSLHVRARRHVLCDAWNMLKWIWNCIFLLAYWKGLEWPWEKNGEGERAFWKSVQCLRRALFWGLYGRISEILWLGIWLAKMIDSTAMLNTFEHREPCQLFHLRWSILIPLSPMLEMHGCSFIFLIFKSLRGLPSVIWVNLGWAPWWGILMAYFVGLDPWLVVAGLPLRNRPRRLAMVRTL